MQDTLIKPPVITKPILPSQDDYDRHHSNQYTIVFTDVHQTEDFDRSFFLQKELDEIQRRHPTKFQYNAVVGEKETRSPQTGELTAIEDRLSFISVMPGQSSIGGYAHIDKMRDGFTHPMDPENGESLVEESEFREYLEPIMERLKPYHKIILEQKNGLYLALFPVIKFQDDQTSHSSRKRLYEMAFREIYCIPPRNAIIPTLSKKPFPETIITANELRRITYLNDRLYQSSRSDEILESNFELYETMQQIFEKANGNLTQFLTFDTDLVPEEYKEWMVMKSMIESKTRNNN